MPETPIEPRKTPRQARSAETVRAILEAAARILETKGFDGYNTNAVAELAGVSIGSLYQYFPGKDALTAGLIQREKAQLLEDVTAIEITDPRSALCAVIAACAAHQMRRPALARLLDFEELRLRCTTSSLMRKTASRLPLRRFCVCFQARYPIGWTPRRPTVWRSSRASTMLQESEVRRIWRDLKSE
nr:TetR/AcrR family transcriptional regulator [Novosphingobium sp. ST904]